VLFRRVQQQSTATVPAPPRRASPGGCRTLAPSRGEHPPTAWAVNSSLADQPTMIIRWWMGVNRLIMIQGWQGGGSRSETKIKIKRIYSANKATGSDDRRPGQVQAAKSGLRLRVILRVRDYLACRRPSGPHPRLAAGHHPSRKPVGCPAAGAGCWCVRR